MLLDVPMPYIYVCVCVCTDMLMEKASSLSFSGKYGLSLSIIYPSFCLPTTATAAAAGGTRKIQQPSFGLQKQQQLLRLQLLHKTAIRKEKSFSDNQFDRHQHFSFLSLSLFFLFLFSFLFLFHGGGGSIVGFPRSVFSPQCSDVVIIIIISLRK